MLKINAGGVSRFAGLALLALAVAAPRAGADSRIEKNLKLDPGGKFVLDSDAGSVTLTGSSERGASVVITSNRDDRSRSRHPMGFPSREVHSIAMPVGTTAFPFAARITVSQAYRSYPKSSPGCATVGAFAPDESN